MAEALWFLANNFHWICGIYLRENVLPKLKRVGKGSGRGSPCQVDIMAFDYSLWMSALAHPPCPRPILSCVSLSLSLKVCCLVGVRQSGVQLRLLLLLLLAKLIRKLVATGTEQTVDVRKYTDEALCRLLCWNCFIAEQRRTTPAQLTFTQIKFCDCFCFFFCFIFLFLFRFLFLFVLVVGC